MDDDGKPDDGGFRPMMDRNGRMFTYCVDCLRNGNEPDQAMSVWYGDSLCWHHLQKRMAR